MIVTVAGNVSLAFSRARVGWRQDLQHGQRDIVTILCCGMRVIRMGQGC